MSKNHHTPGPHDHTPGPWKHNGHRLTALGACAVYALDDSLFICATCDPPEGTRKASKKIQAVNPRLIALGPAMREMVAKLVLIADLDRGSNDFYDAFSELTGEARALLADIDHGGKP